MANEGMVGQSLEESTSIIAFKDSARSTIAKLQDVIAKVDTNGLRVPLAKRWFEASSVDDLATIEALLDTLTTTTDTFMVAVETKIGEIDAV